MALVSILLPNTGSYKAYFSFVGLWYKLLGINWTCLVNFIVLIK
nr:hypothetical protein [Borreliella lanei]